MSVSQSPKITPEVWALIGRLLAVVPPGAELDRHRDVFRFLEALESARHGGERDRAAAAAQIIVDACDAMDIDRFYGLARNAWRLRAGGPRTGPRFWQIALSTTAEP